MKDLDVYNASAPADVTKYETLEFINSALRDEQNNPTSIRVCIGAKSITAKDENNVTATYIDAPAEYIGGEMNSSGRYDASIKLSTVTGEIIQHLEKIASAPMESVFVIYRVFLSTDLTKPQNVPVKMTCKDLSVDKNIFSCKAEFASFVNQSANKNTQTISNFPGLA